MAPVNRGAAVAIAFVVMFQQPLMELIEAGGEIQTRYGLSILPGLAILCIVLLGQHLMQRVAEASKQRQRVETGRLVRMGEALAHAKSMDELRALLNRHLPQATVTEAAWAVLRVGGSCGRTPQDTLPGVRGGRSAG